MIYEYEAEMLLHLNRCIPDLRIATYSFNEDMFGAISKVTKYPSLVYHRVETQWEFPRIWNYKEESFNKIQQEYVGAIVCENTKDAFAIANRVRMFLSKNPYIYVLWNKEKIRVGVRLTYIKVVDERNNYDNKGAKRIIEFGWWSQLFMSETTDYNDHLVEEVRVYISVNGTKVELSDNIISIK